MCFEKGIDEYIKYNVRHPRYSKIFWRSGAVSGSNRVISEIFKNENVKLIITHQLLLRPTSFAGTIAFYEKYESQSIFSFDTTGILSDVKMIPFTYLYDSDNLIFRSIGQTNVEFALSFQLIMEGTDEKEK